MDSSNFISVGELIALGVDAFLFGLYYKMYKSRRNEIDAVKNAPVVDLDLNLQHKLTSAPMPYAVVKGAVQALNKPLRSKNCPDITGVVQELIVKEHQMKWNWGTRWWSETEREVSHAKNFVPFVLKGKSVDVDVADPLAASVLDLTTISTKYEPNKGGFGEALWCLFIGERSRGFQEIERMLTEGTVITGIGNLLLNKDGRIILQPPKTGLRYFLSCFPESSIVKKLETETHILKVMLTVFGIVGFFLLYSILRKWYTSRKERKLLEEEKMRWQELKRERENRICQQDPPISEERPCVVCLTNPREVTILECGHICCCIDCVQALNPHICPICRKRIVRTVPAYIV